MSRLVDTTVCPDCRASLTPSGVCAHCGLSLSGPLGGQLFATLCKADAIITQIRDGQTAQAPAAASSSAPETPSVATAVVPSAGAAAAPTAGTPYPAYANNTPAPPAARQPKKRGGVSIPVILLGLGALSLITAALIFIAVAWGSLGITGRTLVLMGLTACLMALATLATRNALRAAAEALWIIVTFFAVMDFLGARSANLLGLGDLGDRSTVGLCALLAAAGTWAIGYLTPYLSRNKLKQMYGAESLGILALLIMVITWGWSTSTPGVSTSVLMVITAAAAFVLRRPLPLIGLVGVTALSWVYLLIQGFAAAATTDSYSQWWTGLEGWTLLVTALAATVVCVGARWWRRRGAQAIQITAAALTLLSVGALLCGPILPDWFTPVRLGSLLALGAGLMVLAPRVWARGAAWTSGLVALPLTADVLLRPLGALADRHSADVWQSMPDVQMHYGHAWTQVVIAFGCSLVGAALLLHVPPKSRPDARAALPIVVTALLGFAGAAVMFEVGVAYVIAAFYFVGLAAVLALTMQQLREYAATVALGFLAIGASAWIAVVIAMSSSLLIAMVLTALLVISALLYLTIEPARHFGLPTFVSSVLVQLLLALAVLSWLDVAEFSLTTKALVLALVSAGQLLTARALSRDAVSRICLEATTLVPAVIALALAPATVETSMVLTILGTGVAALSVLFSDRDLSSWVGVALLLVATALRFGYDIAVPEAVTLPAAALLLGAGTWRLRADSTVSSFRALGSGLTVALLPATLLVVDEPLSWRAVIVGVAATVVLAVGAGLKLNAPVVAGAAALAVVILVEVFPYAQATPRWISLGTFGILMLLCGVTWEKRRNNAVAAGRYLKGLR